jgi:dUTP pyrophosphatase
MELFMNDTSMCINLDEYKFMVTNAYEDMPKLEYVGDVSDCIDVYTAEETIIMPGEFKLIDLGVIVQAPAGYRLNLYPRSSTFKKYGIIQANSVGIIDATYSGPNDIIRFPAYAPITMKHVSEMVANGAPEPIIIPKHTRIAQLELVQVLKGEITHVSLEEIKNRKDRGGIGSTGN